MQFKAVTKMQGFDWSAGTSWQMVPLGGQRLVALTAADGWHLTRVTSLNPTIAEVAEVPQAHLSVDQRQALSPGDHVFRIKGNGRGTTRVQVWSSVGIVAIELEVCVKASLVVEPAFNFVGDIAGHRTAYSTANVSAWINGLNYIYTGQANITFRPKSARNVTVGKNLGPMVQHPDWSRGTPARDEWKMVTDLGDKKARFNIFLVWGFENEQEKNVLAGGSKNSDCLIKDRTDSKAVVVIAHELGHLLGLDDVYDPGRRRELMYFHDSFGIHIPRQDANKINP